MRQVDLLEHGFARGLHRAGAQDKGDDGGQARRTISAPRQCLVEADAQQRDRFVDLRRR